MFQDPAGVSDSVLFDRDKLLMTGSLRAQQHCSLWVDGSPPQGNSPHTSFFHPPSGSLQLCVRCWHRPGLFLQTLALLMVQESAENVQQAQQPPALTALDCRTDTAGRLDRSEPPLAAGGGGWASAVLQSKKLSQNLMFDWCWM